MVKSWKFAATFAPGTGELLLRQLKQRPVAELRITHQEEGLFVGETTLSPSELSGMRFWHNVFMVLAEAEGVHSLEMIFPYLTTKSLRPGFKALAPQSERLKLRVFDESVPAPLPVHRERSVERVFAGLGLQLVSHQPEMELWIVRRASEYGYIGLLIPKPRFKRRKRAAGELRPELAHALALAAGVTSKDVVLDPFAGYGAIPRELIAGFSPKQVIALEQDPRLAGSLRALAKEKPSLKVLVGDALQMQELTDGSITRIVTDPPWGEYTPLPAPPDVFYAQMLQEFSRVLRAGGVAVILLPNSTEFTAALEQAQQLTLLKSYQVLVSGKKSTLYKLRRSDT